MYNMEYLIAALIIGWFAAFVYLTEEED